MPGRVYAFYKGDGNATIYCSRQVGDRGYNNGWEEIALEGVNAMSDMSAANYHNDIIAAYRSSDDNSKSKIKAFYNGSGIEDYDMHDYNDVEYIRNKGLKRSLENCR